MTQLCHVCNAPDAESHFGGISCRACAAFFRRFFHSPKSNLSLCTCGTRYQNSHPCRRCRIQKCLKAGMMREKVQRTRDKHSGKVKAAPKNVLNLTLMNNPRISFATPSWPYFQSKRREIHGGKFGVQMNIYQLTSFVKQDINLIWQLVNQVFPTTTHLEVADKTALLENFVPKWWQIEPVLNHMEHPELFDNMSEEQCEDILVEFYEGAFLDNREITREQILRIFQPIWQFYYMNMMVPIGSLHMDESETIMFIWLLFFDSAYTNLSPKCSAICKTIRRTILEELKNYQNDSDDGRFFEIVSAPSIIERGEEKFLEEMLICEMNSVQLHEDFKSVLKVNKL